MNYYTVGKIENGETKIVTVDGEFPPLFTTYETADVWRKVFAKDSMIVILNVYGE